MEKDILIAKYMGAEQDIINELPNNYRFKEPIGITFSFNKKELKYRSNWNWLMPVIDKIALSGYSVKIYFIDENVYCKIRDGVKTITHLSGSKENKITIVYKAVVEFIRWHNAITNTELTTNL